MLFLQSVEELVPAHACRSDFDRQGSSRHRAEIDVQSTAGKAEAMAETASD
jgi:hypothetical protein